MRAKINGAEHRIDAPSELEALLRQVRGLSLAELWLTRLSGVGLCVLTSGDRGWPMFLRDPGGAEFSSRNPSYRGNPDAVLELQLSNVQVNE